MKRRVSPQWKYGLVVLSALASCSPISEYSLLEHMEAARTRYEGGRYASFVGEARASGTVEIDGDIRESLTPPFPSRTLFELTVPESGVLQFSPALVMVQSVRRARVEYRITLRAGEETTEVYSEILGAGSSNRWHDREVDLSRWSGKAVLLELETRAVPTRQSVLWADRIQTVWGEPVILERGWTGTVARWIHVPVESIDWLRGGLDSSGIGPDEQVITLSFAIHLLVGGILAVILGELYKFFASTSVNREDFANVLPFFTLTTIAVIAVVQYSPALALGLVGALSVVRFRTSISSPDELVFLLLCIGLGVALGAGHLALAVATVVVAIPFVAWRRVTNAKASRDALLLTLSAETKTFFADDAPSIVSMIQDMTESMTVDRLDYRSGWVSFRAQIIVENRAQAMTLLAALRKRVPRCRVWSLD